jgi:hypothetical protein
VLTMLQLLKYQICQSTKATKTSLSISEHFLFSSYASFTLEQKLYLGRQTRELSKFGLKTLRTPHKFCHRVNEPLMGPYI